MRVLQAGVHPVLRAGFELGWIYLARGEHHLTELPVELVPVDVDVVELVIRPDGLAALVCRMQNVRVPDADVVDRSAIGFDLVARQRFLRPEIPYAYLIETEGLARRLDVPLDVRRLALGFIRGHLEALDGRRDDRAGEDRR